MKISVRLDNAEISIEQRMDLNMTPAIADAREKVHILDTVTHLVTQVIRLHEKRHSAFPEPVLEKENQHPQVERSEDSNPD